MRPVSRPLGGGLYGGLYFLPLSFTMYYICVFDSVNGGSAFCTAALSKNLTPFVCLPFFMTNELQTWTRDTVYINTFNEPNEIQSPIHNTRQTLVMLNIYISITHIDDTLIMTIDPNH